MQARTAGWWALGRLAGSIVFFVGCLGLALTPVHADEPPPAAGEEDERAPADGADTARTSVRDVVA